MRLMLLVVVATCALWLDAGPARAGVGDGAVDDPDVEVGDDVRTLDAQVEVIVWSDGGVVSLPGVFPRCSWQRVRIGDVLLPNVDIADIEVAGDEKFLRVVYDDGRVEYLYLQRCLFADGSQSADYVLIEEANTADTVTAARLKLIELAPDPVGALSPTLGVNHLVGLVSWVWLDVPPQPVVASAQIPGLTTTATATATALTVTPGDGTEPFDCDLDSPPYSPDLVRDDGCTHMFVLVSERSASGTWDMTIDLLWDVSWINSLGESGVADPIITTVVYPLTVIELQARIITP